MTRRTGPAHRRTCARGNRWVYGTIAEDRAGTQEAEHSSVGGSGAILAYLLGLSGVVESSQGSDA